MVVQKFCLSCLSFFDKAEMLDYGVAFIITGSAANLNPVELVFVESVIHKSPACFRYNTVTLKYFTNTITDLAVPVRPIDAMKSDDSCEHTARPDTALQPKFNLYCSCVERMKCLLFSCVEFVSTHGSHCRKYKRLLSTKAKSSLVSSSSRIFKTTSSSMRREGMFNYGKNEIS
jgi:hypothetical protein